MIISDRKYQKIRMNFLLRTAIYGHACHTVDQVLSYFGEPDDISYDVRQLLGKDE